VIALLWNPDNPGNLPRLRAADLSTRSLGIRLLALETRTPEDFDKAFGAMAKGRADALIVLADVMLNNHRARLADLAAAHRLPAAYGQDVSPVGLLTCSVNTHDLFRPSAGYVDRIIKGAKPGDLPIQQASRFELAINLKTAGPRPDHPAVPPAPRRPRDRVAGRPVRARWAGAPGGAALRCCCR